VSIHWATRRAAGTVLFGLASLAGGLAPNAGTLVGARLVQGLGAALMSPAALSILTTTFSYGTDRVRALGAWGAMAGVSSAAGVFLGGVLAAGPGWRWVLFVNLPVIVVILAATFRLLEGDTTGTFRAGRRGGAARAVRGERDTRGPPAGAAVDLPRARAGRRRRDAGDRDRGILFRVLLRHPCTCRTCSASPPSARARRTYRSR
jgi:MFS family permease